MYVSDIQLTFQILEKAMALPPGVVVVAVQETDQIGVLKIRVAAATPPPEEYYLTELSMVGEAYSHPERHPKGSTGEIRGADRDSGSGGEAAVEVVKSPKK